MATIGAWAVALPLLRRSNAESLPERILVEAFINETSEEGAEPVARLVTEWVTQGLAAAGLVQVIDPRGARAVESEFAQAGPVGPESRLETAQTLRATTVVRGALYRAGAENAVPDARKRRASKRGSRPMTSNPDSIEYAAETSQPASSRKNSSPPSGVHTGSLPPSVETWTGGPESTAGKGRTYTSYRPEGLDTYAIQRPSGETLIATSSNWVVKRGFGDAPWRRSRIDRSAPDAAKRLYDHRLKPVVVKFALIAEALRPQVV